MHPAHGRTRGWTARGLKITSQSTSISARRSAVRLHHRVRGGKTPDHRPTVWFRMQRLLDADAAADMLARENSGFSVDASVTGESSCRSTFDREIYPGRIDELRDIDIHSL